MPLLRVFHSPSSFNNRVRLRVWVIWRLCRHLMLSFSLQFTRQSTRTPKVRPTFYVAFEFPYFFHSLLMCCLSSSLYTQELFLLSLRDIRDIQRADVSPSLLHHHHHCRSALLLNIRLFWISLRFFGKNNFNFC